MTASIFETKFHQNQTEAEENQEHGAGEAEEEEMMDQDGLPGLDQAEAAEDGEDYGTSGNKLTGSNKLLVFALGEGIDENYNNVRIVVEKLKLHELHCCFASDMKLINVLIGLSSHSARHACPYCEGEMTLEVGTLRTFGRLADWHNKLQQDAAKTPQRSYRGIRKTTPTLSTHLFSKETQSKPFCPPYHCQSFTFLWGWLTGLWSCSTRVSPTKRPCRRG